MRLRRLADAQEYEQAVREWATHDRISLALPAPAAPADPPSQEDGVVAAFLREWNSGNTVGARRVLLEANTPSAAPLPPEYWRLRAALAVQDRACADAWQALDKYQEATHAPESAPR